MVEVKLTLTHQEDEALLTASMAAVKTDVAVVRTGRGSWAAWEAGVFRDQRVE